MPNNLPLAVDTFVGRDDDLEGLGELLDHARLVTLVGGPGMGKTRLATELARTVLATNPDGVWLVPLAPLGDPDLVSRAVASTLAVSDQSTRPLVDALVAAIGEQHMLIVLDNCEHVLGACASLAASLIASCPNLALVATSQERLATAGEHVWAISGLGVPEATAPSDEATPAASTLTASTTPSPVEPAELSTLRDAAAVRLFEERARAAVRTFALDHDNAQAVVDICRRLDGIPLAIELAAARVNGFSPTEIARHLDDRFAFLTGGDRAGLPRHQTLKAAVDWSYDLLTEPEQILLRRLSLFAGGATPDAIEKVCAGDGVTGDEVLGIVTNLVARSLVVADSTAPDGRYRLLETIRFYGRDRLVEAGEAPTLAASHLRWCIDLAESAEAELNGPNQRTWLERLEADHDNLRAALTSSLEQGNTDGALRLAGALAMFWRINSHFAEGHDWLDRVLVVTSEAAGNNGESGSDEPGAASGARLWNVEASAAPVLAKALWGKALLALMVSNFDSAGPAARASLALYRTLDDPGGIARSLLLLGSGADRTSPGENVADLQQAIAIARQGGDDWCLAYGLAMCGATINGLGDFSAARSMLEESITIARSSQDRQCLNYGLISLGVAAACRGDYEAAEPLLEEALSAADTAYESAMVLTELAEIAVATGNYNRAHELLDGATQEASRRVSPPAVELTIANARLALAEGDLDDAEFLFTQCVEDLRAAGGGSVTAVHGLGEVAMARGDVAGALPLLNEALAIAGSTGRKLTVASVLCSMGNAYRLAGDLLEATSMHRQALDMRVEADDTRGTLASVEALAGLLARTGKAEWAAQVLACAQAVRDGLGIARSPAERIAHDADKAATAEALGEVDFEAAWDTGTSMALEAAVARVSSPKRPRAPRPATGTASLTDAERQVARLALQRFTNVEIAERLFISLSTVKSHINRIFAKLAVSSRPELISRYSEDNL